MSLGGMLRYVWKSAFGGAHMLEPGEIAPDFNTKDHRNRPIRLSDFRGRKVVLWFFPKADTPG